MSINITKQVTYTKTYKIRSVNVEPDGSLTYFYSVIEDIDGKQTIEDLQGTLVDPSGGVVISAIQSVLEGKESAELTALQASGAIVQ